MFKGGPAGAACLLSVGPRQRVAGRAAGAGPGVPHADPKRKAGDQEPRRGRDEGEEEMPSPGRQAPGWPGEECWRFRLAGCRLASGLLGGHPVA
jgi:hypothetical protein